MTDKFQTFDLTLEMPATNAFAITPSDSVSFDQPTRGLMVNAGGAITVVFVNDTEAVTLTVTDGILYPFRLKQVLATGTDYDVSLTGLY